MGVHTFNLPANFDLPVIEVRRMQQLKVESGEYQMQHADYRSSYPVTDALKRTFRKFWDAGCKTDEKP